MICVNTRPWLRLLDFSWIYVNSTCFRVFVNALRTDGVCSFELKEGELGDVGEVRRTTGRTVESSKNEFLACRTVCSFDFCSSLPRGRNDLSRLVGNGSVGFGRRRKSIWQNETERTHNLGKMWIKTLKVDVLEEGEIWNFGSMSNWTILRF